MVPSTKYFSFFFGLREPFPTSNGYNSTNIKKVNDMNLVSSFSSGNVTVYEYITELKGKMEHIYEVDVDSKKSFQINGVEYNTLEELIENN